MAKMRLEYKSQSRGSPLLFFPSLAMNLLLLLCDVHFNAYTIEEKVVVRRGLPFSRGRSAATALKII